MTNFVLLTIIAVWVHARFRKDFELGIASSLFLLILLPIEIRIEIPGALPELTGHRLILLLMLAHVFPRINSTVLAPFALLLRLLCCLAVSRLFTTLLTAVDPAASAKVLFAFLIEVVLFFLLIAASLQSRRSVSLALWSIVSASLVVAVLAAVEKYAGRNLVAEFIPGTVDNAISVTATYRHRILLGYAMAFAFPLALTLRNEPGPLFRRWVARVAFLALPAASYFANSRGPWIGVALAAAVMWFMSAKLSRKRLMALALCGALLLILKPGVLETVRNLWEQSFSKETLKGRSADYRKLLWTVVHGELTKSPATMLLGYGGHSTEVLDLSEYFEQGAGGSAAGLGHTSWDSQFASNCMQYGYLGFGFELMLYGTIIVCLLRAWQRSAASDREISAACFAVVLAFMWAMLTVAIFNPQLDYLVWTAIAIGWRLGQLPLTSPEVSQGPGSPSLAAGIQ